MNSNQFINKDILQLLIIKMLLNDDLSCTDIADRIKSESEMRCIIPIGIICSNIHHLYNNGYITKISFKKNVEAQCYHIEIKGRNWYDKAFSQYKDTFSGISQILNGN